MSDHDCLIWVDGPYRTINQFIREAEKRGCCRKVAFWPSWVKPGKTGVFLAHRGGHRRTDRGSIFGYFTLRGVDIVFTQEKCERYKDLLRKYWEGPQDWKELEALLDFWRKEFRGKRLPVTIPGKLGTKPKRRRDDEVETVSRSYDQSIIDFLRDLLISCEPNGDASSAFGYGISTDQARLEADRDCGSRPGNPALYFVDALARELEALFCEILKRMIEEASEEEEEGDETKKEEARKKVVATLRKEAEKNKKNGRGQGIPELEEAVQKAVSKRKKWATLPPRLSGVAYRRGALVVFERPYPSFRRLPQAAFRGLLRIDGDALLKRIGAAYALGTRQVTLPYYDSSQQRRQGKRTKQELVTHVAQELQASKGFAQEIWGCFVKMITRELQERGRITLTDIGTFWVKKSRDGKQVEFERSEVLEREVRQADC